MLFQDLFIIQTPYKGSIEPFDVKLRLWNQRSFCRQSFAIKKLNSKSKLKSMTSRQAFARMMPFFDLKIVPINWVQERGSSLNISWRGGSRKMSEKEKNSITRNLHCWQKRLKFCFQSDSESFSHQRERNWKLLNGGEFFFATALFFVAAAPWIQN